MQIGMFPALILVEDGLNSYNTNISSCGFTQ